MRKVYFIILVAVFAVLAILAFHMTSEKPLTDKRVAIIIFDRYNPIELEAANKISGNCTIIAADRINRDYDIYIGDMNPKDIGQYDALILIGGSGVYDRVTGKIDDPNMERVIEIVKEANRQGKIIGAICAAPAILAKAGILNGKEATIYPGLEYILNENGAKYVKRDVVVSGNIITAKNPNVADEFAKTIAERLGE
ncbi:MAG TPA: hypothetical protein GXX31_02460 [Methanothermobacter sp.]|jgi:protease I|uniref:DJ-1/PfpI domain-containing protein n=1 Tax=Methanothermobacter tenebrarum TaxID=680118 RepID=A0ABM7YDB9_9EURY|nr:DJ-1/PfpI family protein [Methanothermobacter tenebrarum]MDD3453888.1 DJ-1/PfpI family protein [Methanobacteriales archaeon]MDI6881790.1 DJ-1/PfpI family protein [Methanothermobacter sp.]MDX9692599.1 DJ-1/PfpI family protein [Methanothermobacter sp.]BDH79240.1 hypothetical protein MTTB_06190 [Methanothermobacter tenebrarum]HHW16235.1 hypothetical protein [Methanothermobacter sp.]